MTYHHVCYEATRSADTDWQADCYEGELVWTWNTSTEQYDVSGSVTHYLPEPSAWIQLTVLLIALPLLWTMRAR